jgi:DNA-binding transcriptional regulator YbjK
MRVKLYDPACEELAKHFLQHSIEQSNAIVIQSLARSIQQSIEDWFEDNPAAQRTVEDRRGEDA